MPATLAKTLTLKVPPELDRRLERAARRRRAPKAELMRSAIERFLDAEEPASRSFGAEAGDLAGVVKAAPDLSYGKRHLRGYGR